MLKGTILFVKQDEGYGFIKVKRGDGTNEEYYFRVQEVFGEVVVQQHDTVEFQLRKAGLIPPFSHSIFIAHLPDLPFSSYPLKVFSPCLTFLLVGNKKSPATLVKPIKCKFRSNEEILAYLRGMFFIKIKKKIAIQYL